MEINPSVVRLRQVENCVEYVARLFIRNTADKPVRIRAVFVDKENLHSVSMMGQQLQLQQQQQPPPPPPQQQQRQQHHHPSLEGGLCDSRLPQLRVILPKLGLVAPQISIIIEIRFHAKSGDKLPKKIKRDLKISSSSGCNVIIPILIDTVLCGTDKD